MADEQVSVSRITANRVFPRPTIKSGTTITLLVVGLILSGRALADCAQSVGEFVAIQGSVETQLEEGSAWQAATLDSDLCEGSSIRVGARSRAAIALINEAVLRIDENTTMRLVDINEEEEERSLLDIIKGALQSFSRKPRKLSINSPYLNGSIEGTEFVFRVTDEQSEVTVFEGTVIATNAQGELALAANQSAVAAAGQPPVARILVRPRDLVNWGLYYPRILIAGDAVVDPKIIDIADLLDSGRIDEAQARLAPLLSSSNPGLAYALSSVIDVTLNRNESALENARRSVELAPSPASSIALSYAQQANLDLEAARETLREGMREHPDHPLVLARLAELELMLGARGEAVTSARRAVSLDPALDNSRIVLGYSSLALSDFAAARNEFDAAIALNSSNPLSRLGRGLAKIGSGDLAAGRADIEAAVALDSNDSLLRSYLGKSYFEEKRSELAEDQYGIAKTLDPNDPTAYLYSGILKQTENRPVEALDDIEQSIKRNDNRAVYRSRLLLDQDRAARGTSIARAYTDLGFTRLAIPEASNSLLIDPSNASAHRFLSDSYRGTRRTEIGRVSELLQAQMLQDVNINPVQPSLSGTNLNIVTLGGPAQAGFNEFTPLFQKNQVRTDATLRVGNFDTEAAEVALSGVSGNLSFSLGALSYDTDGWRDNNAVEQDLRNLFVQYAVNEKVNLQAEYFNKESLEGDLAFNFDPDSFVLDKNSEKEETIRRLGLRVKPSLKSTLLVSYIEAENQEIQHESDLFGPACFFLPPCPPALPDPLLAAPFQLLDFSFDDELDIDVEQAEAQYIFDDANFNLVIGAADSKNEKSEEGVFNVFSQDGTDILIFPGTSSFPSPFTLDEDVDHSRAYLYYNYTAHENLQFTLGASRDEYTEETIEVDETNTKLGLQWMANSSVRVRAAAFGTVKPILANNRTLEPSQISGFNQFYDDINGTLSEKVGLAFDLTTSSTSFVVLSFSKRQLEVPLFDVINSAEIREDWEEHYHSLGYYQSFGKRWSLVAEIIYDSFENTEGDAAINFDDPIEVNTISVPVSANYFNPHGYFIGVKGTHVDQEVERGDFTARADGEDDFFVVDVAAGYRLAKRRGHISLGILNLFDEDFDFQDDSYREFSSEAVTGPYFPERTVIGQVVLNF